MTVDLPLDERSMQNTLSNVCRAFAIRCSMELTTSMPPGYGLSFSPATASYDLSGFSAREALDKIVELAPDFAWQQDGDVYRLKSSSLARAKDLPLDRRIGRYERTLETLSAVVEAMRIFYAPPATATGGRGRGLPGGVVGGVVAGIQAPSMVIGGVGFPSVSERDRTIEVKLADATVRQFLDEVARLYGNLSWSARYLDANGTYPQFELTLSTPSGGTGTTIMVR